MSDSPMAARCSLVSYSITYAEVDGRRYNRMNLRAHCGLFSPLQQTEDNGSQSSCERHGRSGAHGASGRSCPTNGLR